MKEIIKKHPAVVLNMSETGLGVGRSLGRNGITVLGLDYKKNIGFHSKYIKAEICPDPLSNEKKFLEFLIKLGKKFKYKPVLFITSDNFLIVISKNREILQKYFLINLPSKQIINSIFDKYLQYKLVLSKGIDVPLTYSPESYKHLMKIKHQLTYPIFIKGRDVNKWRNSSVETKGFVIKSEEELIKLGTKLFKKKVKYLTQEIVKGPDTNHYKVCSYFSKKGRPLLSFTLKKIRQNPIHFGIGCTIESVKYPELLKIGEKLFSALGYKGVVSTEFKIDQRDNKLKLIEINLRYWQQNILADVCGMNFPLIQYLDLTNQNPKKIKNFKTGIKWVNIYMDIDSFLSYKKIRELSFMNWINSLKGRKVFSDFAWDDIKPTIYEISSRVKLLKIQKYLFRIFKAYIHSSSDI